MEPASHTNRSAATLQFLGAAGVVTGSKYLLKTPEKKILVDCGLFQGIKPLRLLNREPFPVDPKMIDTIIITHAHLDHTGYLPVLVKQGFKGKIWMTAPTADLAALILRDSAKLQEEDADQANEEKFSKHQPALPLYTVEDVERTIKYFNVVEDQQWFNLSEHIRFRYRRNGHILGACFIEMDCYDKQIVFSGDIGRKRSLTLAAPEQPEKADILLIESTYGDRLHPVEPIEDQMEKVIMDMVKKQGNLLIPSFAVGRAQELMVLINKLKNEHRIPDLPVYLDSPMGTDATLSMNHYNNWHTLSKEACEQMFRDVIRVKTVKDTYNVIANKEPKIVIAASGMLTGGRVLHYLKYYIKKESNIILMSGYQAEGTRGRALLDNTHELKIHGEYHRVKAEVRQLTGLSAHADQQELLDWASSIKEKPQKVYVVHGEPSAAYAFSLKLQDTFGWDCVVPALNAEVDI